MRKIIFLVLFLLVFLAQNVVADIGPKPTVTFKVNFPPGTSEDGILVKMLGCDKYQSFGANEIDNYEDRLLRPAIETHLRTYPGVTIDKIRVHELDFSEQCVWSVARLAWGGGYNEGTSTFSYMPPSPFKLMVYVPSQKQVYISASQTLTRFNDAFDATLKTDGSIEINNASPISNPAQQFGFILSFVSTLVIELGAAASYFAFIRKKKIPKMKVLLTLGLANVISVPLVWFAFPSLGMDSVAIFFFSEAFAVMFEAAFLNYRLPEVSFKEAFGLSLVLNTLSVIIGGILLFLLGII